jgi:hypothetical protein
MTERNPCPAGWRVPTKAELDKLVEDGKVSKTWVAGYNSSGVKGYTLY